MRALCGVWLACLLLAPLSLRAADTGVPASEASAPLAPVDVAMRILAVEEPPASFVEADGRVAGYAVDVLREIQRRVGNRDAVRVEPESRVYESGLRQPNVVLLSFSRLPEREESFHWLVKILRKPWVFYGRADDARGLSSLDEARALRAIAVVGGDVRARWLQAQGFSNLLRADSHEQAMRMLLAQRVDAVFSEPQGVAWFCRVQGCGDIPPRPLWSPRSSDVYILLSKRGTSPELAARWQQAAAEALADGSIEAIGRRWVQESALRFGIEAVWRHGVLDFCPAAGC